MTEAQAWREIARRIVEGKWGKEGLCFEVYRLYGEDDGMPWAIYYRMTNRIGQNLLSGGYAYPKGTEPEGRALAALLFAVQVEDERKQRRKVSYQPTGRALRR
jgi:hypothetical protein